MTEIELSKKDKFFNKLLEWMLYLFVFLLPWQTRWIFKEASMGFEYGRMSLYGFDILLILMFAIFLLARSLKVKFTTGMSKAEAIGVVIILILIGIMAYSAHFWAANQDISYYLLVRFLLALILLGLVWKIKFSQIKLIVVLTTAACLQAVFATAERPLCGALSHGIRRRLPSCLCTAAHQSTATATASIRTTPSLSGCYRRGTKSSVQRTEDGGRTSADMAGMISGTSLTAVSTGHVGLAATIAPWPWSGGATAGSWRSWPSLTPRPHGSAG